MSMNTRVAPAKAHYDWGLLTIVVTLLMFGLVMVFSASFAYGIILRENPYYHLTKQIAWIAIGIVAMIIAARIPYTFWQRWSIWLMGGALVALIAVLIFGSETFGATMSFLRGSIQPSEPAKIIIIIYVSTWLASKGTRIRDVQVGLLPFAVLMGVITVLLVAQPDISAAILIVVTATIMLYIAGAEIRQLLIAGLIGAATFWLIISYSAYAPGRIDRYLQSIDDPLASTEYQTEQAIKALLRGGMFGVGLGDGVAKVPGHLPASWHDNIYAVIGEELGLLGTLFVILLFALLAYRGLRTALHARDNFGMLLATGITALLTLQTLLNMAVGVALAPPTGVTLPLISYGGSSVLTVLGAIGILLSISRYSEESGAPSPTGKTAYAGLDFGWRNRGTRLSGVGSSSASLPDSGDPASGSHARRRPRRPSGP